MKTTIKKIFFLIIFLPFLTSSCDNEEFFQLTNPPEFPWNNVEEFEMAVQYPYSMTFQYLHWYHLFMDERYRMVYLSDIVTQIPSAPYDEAYERQTSVETVHTNRDFRTGFIAIANLNTALDFVYKNDGNPFPNATLEDKENNIDRIIGELHFMRAYNYFLLAKTFLPLPGSNSFETDEIFPLRNKFPENMTEAVKGKLATSREVFNFILEDLKIAKDYLPERYIPGKMHPSYEFGRANKFAAAGMLSRVYFFLGGEENHTKALEELNFIIENNNGDYNLSEDPIEAFNKSIPSRGKEVIWYGLYYDASKNAMYRRFTFFSKNHYKAKSGGRGENWNRGPWGRLIMNHETLKEIGWLDQNYNVTEEAIKDKRYNQLYYRFEPLPEGWNDKNSPNYLEDPDPTYYETLEPNMRKPTVWGDKYFRGDNGSYTNVPVIRLAELYLTRSIIRFNKGDHSGALEDLNTVRRRSGLDNFEGDFSEEIIHIERIKEMAFEGDRLPYLIGLRKDLPPGARNQETMSYPYEIFWPIPKAELDFYE